MERVARIIRQTRSRKLLDEVTNVALVWQENQSEILRGRCVHTNIKCIDNLTIIGGDRLPLDQFCVVLHL